MNENSLGGLGVVLLIIVVWLGVHSYDQSKTIDQQKETISDLKSTIDYCSNTINDANSNIDDLNSQVDDASAEAWSDYDTMGSTLEGLQEGDTVENDCYVPFIPQD